MTNSHFPYQKILDLRSKETVQAKSQVAQALRQQMDIESMLVETGNDISRLQAKIEKKQIEGTSVHELRILADELNVLTMRRRKQQYELFSARRTVMREQQLLLHRQKEERKWSQLKEKHVTDWRDALKKDEQKQMDEIANQRYHLSSTSSGYKR